MYMTEYINTNYIQVIDTYCTTMEVNHFKANTVLSEATNSLVRDVKAPGTVE